MSTETKNVETLASWRGLGNYGLPRQSRLVRRGEKHYLVHDVYCGEGSLQGGVFRPFVYVVPSGLVATVAELVANGDDEAWYDDEGRGFSSKIGKLEYEVIADLQTLGAQSRLDWTADL